MQLGVPVFGWLVVVVLGALSARLLIGRRPIMRACPRCRHPLVPGASIVGATCSECGYLIRSEVEVTAWRRHPVLGSISLFLTLAIALWIAGAGVQRAILGVVLSPYRVEITQKAFGCLIEILRPRWNDSPIPLAERVRISRRGRVVFDSELLHPSAGAGWVANDGSDPSPAIWIRSDSGGSGGYSETWVFDLEGDGGFLPRLHLENGWFEEAAHRGFGTGTGPGTTHTIHPRDGGPIPSAPSEWRQPILGFRYWLTSGAGSPAPMLRGWLDWSHGFVVGPAPDAASSVSAGDVERALGAIATAATDLDRIRASADSIFSPLLRVYLDLVFEGRAREAAVFLRDAHRGGLARVLESGAVSDLPRSLEAFEAMLHARILEEDIHGAARERNGGVLVSVRDLGG